MLSDPIVDQHLQFICNSYLAFLLLACYPAFPENTMTPTYGLYVELVGQDKVNFLSNKIISFLGCEKKLIHPTSHHDKLPLYRRTENNFILSQLSVRSQIL